MSVGSTTPASRLQRSRPRAPATPRNWVEGPSPLLNQWLHGEILRVNAVRDRMLRHPTSYPLPLAVSNSSDLVHVPLDRWNQWQGVHRHLTDHHPGTPGAPGTGSECVFMAIGCSADLHEGVSDSEECFMRRTMELLLPGGGVLQQHFREGALGQAMAWRGSDVSEFRRILDAAPNGTSEGPGKHLLLPGQGEQSDDGRTRRFAGALHIRAIPPKLESADRFKALRGRHSKSANQQRDRATFDRFFAALLPDSSWAAGAFDWSCVRRQIAAAYATDRPEALFVATDVSGLCSVIAGYGSGNYSDSALPAISCFDVEPVHLAKDQRHSETPISTTATQATRSGHVIASIKLHAYQHVVLEWYLLSRSRWLAGVGRKGDTCVRGGSRAGNHGPQGALPPEQITHHAPRHHATTRHHAPRATHHNAPRRSPVLSAHPTSDPPCTHTPAAHKPGNSFYAWALALSNLGAPLGGSISPACWCGVDGGLVAVWVPR